jgi:hypothetical protein
MAGGPLSAARWFESRSLGAPAALRERSRGFLEDDVRTDDPAPVLAGGAMRALRGALAEGHRRSGARDLLAADALLTLALLARAERDPGTLAGFAEEVRRAGLAVR